MNLQRGHFVSAPQFQASNGIPPPPPEGSSGARGKEDQPLLRLNLLRALQLHRRLAAGIALAGLAFAIAYVIKAWPVYTAQSQIYIQPVQSKVLPQGNDQSEPLNSTAYDAFVQQQVQSASNPDVLINALHKLDQGAWQRRNETEQSAADRLGHAVEVARVGTSYEVSITAKAKDPQLAAKIANVVALGIVERAAGEGNAGDEQRIAVLREERDRIQNELNADYAEQNDLNKQLGMAAVGTAPPDLIDDEIGKTREELIKAQTEHDEAEARYAAMKAGQGSPSAAMDAEADDMVSADAGLASMKQSLNQRRAALITQMANLTPNNPAYKQDQDELTKINANLDGMMKDLRGSAAQRIQQKLRTDLERTAGVEAQLNGQLRQLAGTAAGATPKLQRASDLANDIVRLRARYTTVDEQLHNVMLQDSVPGAVNQSVVAVAPMHPTISGILKKAVPVALGGLILGLLVAVVLNYFDPRVYIAADIEQELGFAPMAVLPDFDEVPDEVAAEQLLRLASTIEHARQQGDLKNCIFTGAAAGTGVTTLATRVRDVLEAMGRPTVLLDASGMPLPITHGGAKVQPAAQRGSRSTALLQQVTAETEMRQESLVLTDTAPLLISAETEYLARFVDSAIVVVESGVTTRPQLVAAVNALQRLGVGTVGFVLNRVKLATADPAFRESIQEIEKHLRTQRVLVSKRKPRSEYSTAGTTPETRELPSGTGVVAQSALELKETSLSSDAAAQSSMPLDYRTSTSIRVGAPIGERASVTEPDPWWLSDEHPQRNEVHQQEPKTSDHKSPSWTSVQTSKEPSPNSQSWERTAISRTPESSAAKPSVWMESGEDKSEFIGQTESIYSITPTTDPSAAHATEIVGGTADPASTQAEPVAIDEIPCVTNAVTDSADRPSMQPAPIISVATVHEAEFRETNSRTANTETTPVAILEPVENAAQALDLGDRSEPSDSRLGGLRSIFFSLGLKNLGKVRGDVRDGREPLVPIEGKIEPAILGNGLKQPSEPSPIVTVPVESTLPSESGRPVTANPEFLPPREFVPVKDVEPIGANEAAAGSTRREKHDDLRTLPSRRGQYKTNG